MSDGCLVSVIVPTFGRPDLLRRAVLSILGQSYKNIEVVIVDDNPPGSEDSYQTGKVVSEFSSKTSRLKFVKNIVPLGGGGARNVGISASEGEYIAFLDDDDEFVFDKIERQIQLFVESDSNLAIVSCRMSIFKEGENRAVQTTRIVRGGQRNLLRENVFGCIAGTPTMLVRREPIMEAGGFRDLRSGQDWALIFDILKLGYSMDYVNRSLVNVYVKAEGRISTGKNKILSLTGEILELKGEMIQFLGLESDSDKIYADHYYQIASVIKFDDKKGALVWFWRSLQKGLDKRKALKLLFGIVFGRRASEFLRSGSSRLLRFS